MREFFKGLLNDPTVILLVQSTPAMAISLFGGLVAMFQKPHKKISVRFFVGGLLTAAFVGFLMDLIVRYFGGNDNIRVFSIAISGYCARGVLDRMEKRFLKVVEGKDEDDDDA